MSKKTSKPVMKRRSRRSAGTLKEAKLRLWSAISRLTEVIGEEPDTKTVVSAAHALAACIGQYTRLSQSEINEPFERLITKQGISLLSEPQ